VTTATATCESRGKICFRSTIAHSLPTPTAIAWPLLYLAVSTFGDISLTPMNPYLPSTPTSSSSHYAVSTPQTASTSQQPVTRSRTLFYLSIRDSSITPRRGPKRGAGSYGNTIDIEDEEAGLLGQQASSGLPPKWVDLSDEVEDILRRGKAKSES